jgi:hypothetical protein
MELELTLVSQVKEEPWSFSFLDPFLALSKYKNPFQNSLDMHLFPALTLSGSTFASGNITQLKC